MRLGASYANLLDLAVIIKRNLDFCTSAYILGCGHDGSQTDGQRIVLCRLFHLPASKDKAAAAGHQSEPSFNRGQHGVMA
ncbi:hypothetical protein D3C77_471180 [compost metagenome]